MPLIGSKIKQVSFEQSTVDFFYNEQFQGV